MKIMLHKAHLQASSHVYILKNKPTKTKNTGQKAELLTDKADPSNWDTNQLVFICSPKAMSWFSCEFLGYKIALL